MSKFARSPRTTFNKKLSRSAISQRKRMFEDLEPRSMLAGDVYFSATGDGVGNELFKYNGTTVSLVADINTGAGSSSPGSFAVFNDKLYFSANGGTNGIELWVYDGTNPPTQIPEIVVGAGDSSPTNLTVFNNKLYFSAKDASGDFELYVYTGSGTPSRVANINTTITANNPAGSSSPNSFIVTNNKLYFGANNGTNGTELWQYDGTNPPSMVQDLLTGSNSQGALSGFFGTAKLVGNQIYFTGSNSTFTSSGQAIELLSLFSYNTSTNTFADREGDSFTRNAFGPFAVLGNQLYYTAFDLGNSVQLVSHDTTNVSPNRAFPNSGGTVSQSSLTVFNNKLYFSGLSASTFESELYVYDGSSTTKINIAPDSPTEQSSSPGGMFEFNGKLIFRANSRDGSGSELYSLDTSNTFTRISDLNTTTPGSAGNGNSNPTGFILFAPVVANTPPVITEGAVASVTMSEDGSPTPFSLTLNATDSDSPTLTWSILSSASHGTATASGTGLFKAIGYTPNANYNGPDQFIVQVSDGTNTDTITVNVTINEVNDAPVITEVSPISVTMSEDGSPTPFSLTLNASDIDSSTLTWAIITPAANGIATASGTGLSKAIGYTPSANYSGTDSFVVRVFDGSAFDDITVNVTINAVNDAPEITEVSPISVTMDEDGSPTPFNLTLNATDIDSPTLTWSIVTPAANGTATASGTGLSKAIGYTPAPGYSGTDSFVVQVSDGNGGTDTITVNVTIDAVNDAPVITQGAVANVTMSEDGSPTAFNLTLDATDAENDTITWSILTTAAHGTASVSGTGASKVISYVPDANYNGTDSFVVQVDDGNGGFDTITVNVTIDPVNDAPIITQGNSISRFMSEDGSPVPFDLFLTTVDVDSPSASRTWSILTPAAHGTAIASGTGSTKTIGYTPDPNYNGTDSFVVQVDDGSGGFDTITVNVTINAENDAPVITQGAVANVTMSEDSSPTPFSLTLNATDAENDTITWSVLTGAAHGTASVSGTGASKVISYIPDANYNGTDSFVVQVDDGNGGTDTITVNVTIDPVNDAPEIITVIGNSSTSVNVTMSEDSNPTPFNLTLNASDPDGNTLTWSIQTGAAHGTANVSGTGTSKAISYVPDANYNGTDSFVVKIDDGNGGVDTITINVTIQAVNDAPTAGDLAFVTNSATQISSNLQGNDPEGGNLTYVIVTYPTQGTLIVSPSTGVFQYTPNANSTGSDSFTYKVLDPQSLESNVATVSIDFRVTAVQTGNKLVILGTGGIDDLVISKTPNTITVTGLNGTLINGNNTSVTFAGITQIEASLLNGNDSLWVQSNISLDTLTINGGDGNDLIILGNDSRDAGNNDVNSQTFKDGDYLRVKQSLVVNAGEGDDTVTERKMRVNISKTVDLGAGNDKNDVYWSLADANTILGGTGHDTIFLGYLSSYGVAFYDTGAGNDLLGSYASRFYENASFLSGTESDTVALDVNAYDKNVTVDTSTGNDYLLFARSTAAALVDIKTGDGNDKLFIGRYISSVSPSGVASYTNGGSIIDRMNLDTGAGVETSQMFYNQIRQFFANYGAGRDDITIEDNVFLEDSTLDGGADGALLTQKNNSSKLRFRNI